MKPSDFQQTVALFRYGLIADLVHLPPGSKGLQARLNDKARQIYVIPGSQRTRVAAETLNQRIVTRYHMTGLARDELPNYLSHRLQLAGCTLPLFEEPAIESLYQASQGLPRRLNRAAHYALSAAALAKTRQVSATHVESALEEIRP